MSSEVPAGAVTPRHADAIAGFLEGAGVAFELVEHEPTIRGPAKAHAAHMPPEQVAKTVVLRDGGAYVIAAITAVDRLDPREVVRITAATVADVCEE
ncbi:MAG TPA: hypothetical protein VMU32_06660 [Solirubrobacteraceae bacterium]|nr:hypothetical protein [Solirubrobacteraceae bacterium]